MDAYGRMNSYWDLAQQPASFSTLADDDFLALLEKQFPTTVGNNHKPLDVPPDGVDPQSLTTFPIPNPSPPSSDSSPSPPSANDTAPSRPQSGVFSQSPTSEHDLEDPRLKRKASDESMDDEPTHKSPHTNPAGNHKKSSSSSRRKSTGNPQQDEFRLLKRKEQNRAAQRAFRERKEKHVKDLEDQVAALEAKNQVAESENENLRDLLTRLQSENMALKQGTFTFSMPKNDSTVVPPPSSFNNTPTQSTPSAFASSPIASSSKSPDMGPPNPPPFDFNFGSLIPFDPAVLSVLDETPPTATDGAMNMDFGFGPMNGSPPYRTLASNPMYMSFAEPMDYGMTSSQPPTSSGQLLPNNDSNNMDTNMGLASYDSWSPPAENSLTSQSMDSLDQLFGGNYMGAQSPVDFSALLRSPPSSISPVSHAQSIRTSASNSQSSSSASNSPSNNSTTPSSSMSSSSPPQSSPVTPNPPGVNVNGQLSCSKGGECPKTKADLKKAIDNQGSSPFVEKPSSANGSCLRKGNDAIGGPMIMCQGSSFPKTEKSDKNVEVLTAWRSITSDPQFKDVDINELCTEFTSKARCDGTKVVLEPEGVHHIIETLAARRQGSQQQQQPQQK